MLLECTEKIELVSYRTLSHILLSKIMNCLEFKNAFKKLICLAWKFYSFDKINVFNGNHCDFKKIPLKVTKTIEEAIMTNEPKYKNILNHQGNVKRINSDSLVWSLL